MLLAVTIGVFIALIVWTLIVKSQVSSTLSSNSTLATVLNLLGSKPAGSS